MFLLAFALIHSAASVAVPKFSLKQMAAAEVILSCPDYRIEDYDVLSHLAVSVYDKIEDQKSIRVVHTLDLQEVTVMYNGHTARFNAAFYFRPVGDGSWTTVLHIESGDMVSTDPLMISKVIPTYSKLNIFGIGELVTSFAMDFEISYVSRINTVRVEESTVKFEACLGTDEMLSVGLKFASPLLAEAGSGFLQKYLVEGSPAEPTVPTIAFESYRHPLSNLALPILDRTQPCPHGTTIISAMTHIGEQSEEFQYESVRYHPKMPNTVEVVEWGRSLECEYVSSYLFPGTVHDYLNAVRYYADHHSSTMRDIIMLTLWSE